MNHKTNSMEKRIKRRKRKFIIPVMIFLIAVSAILVIKTDIFSVRYIEVNGNVMLADDYIVNVSGITIGNNIFKEKKDTIQTMLLSQPYIKNAEVKRAFPNKFKIQIVERKRAASIIFMDSFIIIDNEGYVLESSVNDEGLLVIEGMDILNFNEGNLLSVSDRLQLDKAINIIKELENIGIPMVEVDMTNIDDIKLRISENLICQIGKGDKLDYKLMTLGNILLDLSEKNIVRGIIDISGEGYPSYRPVE